MRIWFYACMKKSIKEKGGKFWFQHKTSLLKRVWTLAHFLRQDEATKTNQKNNTIWTLKKFH